MNKKFGVSNGEPQSNLANPKKSFPFLGRNQQNQIKISIIYCFTVFLITASRGFQKVLKYNIRASYPSQKLMKQRLSKKSYSTLVNVNEYSKGGNTNP